MSRMWTRPGAGPAAAGAQSSSGPTAAAAAVTATPPPLSAEEAFARQFLQRCLAGPSSVLPHPEPQQSAAINPSYSQSASRDYAPRTVGGFSSRSSGRAIAVGDHVVHVGPPPSVPAPPTASPTAASEAAKQPATTKIELLAEDDADAEAATALATVRRHVGTVRHAGGGKLRVELTMAPGTFLVKPTEEFRLAAPCEVADAQSAANSATAGARRERDGVSEAATVARGAAGPSSATASNGSAGARWVAKNLRVRVGAPPAATALAPPAGEYIVRLVERRGAAVHVAACGAPDVVVGVVDAATQELEPVPPAVGAKGLVVRGAHRGEIAEVLGVTSAAAATLKLGSGTVVEAPLSDVCVAIGV